MDILLVIPSMEMLSHHLRLARYHEKSPWLHQGPSTPPLCAQSKLRLVVPQPILLRLILSSALLVWTLNLVRLTPWCPPWSNLISYNMCGFCRQTLSPSYYSPLYCYLQRGFYVHVRNNKTACAVTCYAWWLAPKLILDDPGSFFVFKNSP